ncbi:MAG: ROK family protein [Clostridia bacterium]|nr:ROK family protein [Clostridia bacterium]
MKNPDQLSIRRLNLLRLLEQLHTHNGITRQHLALHTGLSLMSITNLVDLLNEHGALRFEESPATRTIGRKADIIHLCEGDQVFAILDLTEFHYCAVTHNLTVLPDQYAFPKSDELCFCESLTAFLKESAERLSALKAEHEVLGVAVVVPGPYDAVKDVVMGPRAGELANVPLLSILKKTVGDYHYHIDADIHYSVRAFAPRAAQLGHRVVYYFYIGAENAGAVLLNGDILHGSNEAAGNAASLPVMGGGLYRDYLSLRGLAKSCGVENTDKLNAPALMESIQQAADADPQQWQNAIEKAVRLTAEMLYQVVCLLDPGMIILDCPYHAYDWEHLTKSVNDYLSAKLGPCRKAPQILLPYFDRPSVLLGAVQVLSRDWVDRITL